MLIGIEQTQMGTVTDDAYLIEAEAMALLHQYPQVTGGSGVHHKNMLHSI